MRNLRHQFFISEQPSCSNCDSMQQSAFEDAVVDCCHGASTSPSSSSQLRLSANCSKATTNLQSALTQKHRRRSRTPTAAGGVSGSNLWSSILSALANCQLPSISSSNRTAIHYCYALAIFVCIASLPVPVTSQAFESQPKTSPYLVHTGDPGLTLDCVVNSAFAQSTLNWIRTDRLGKTSIVATGRDNRFPNDFTLDTSCAGCYKLQLGQLSFERHNGRYQCQIQDLQGIKESNEADVIVLVAPSSLEISAPPPTVLTAGQIAHASCRSKGGNPPPELSWKFSNGTHLPDGRITNATDLNSFTEHFVSWLVTPENDGQSLECQLDSPAIDVANSTSWRRSSSEMNVYYAPVVSVFVGDSNKGTLVSEVVLTEAGQSLSLYCDAKANPAPYNFLWAGGGKSWASRAISFVVDPHSSQGNYSCTAISSYGSGSTAVQLEVQYAPEISVISETTLDEGSSLLLLCSVNASPPANFIQWRGPDGLLLNQPTLQIASIGRRQAGNYSCTARNVLSLTGYNRPGSPVDNGMRESTRQVAVFVKHAPGQARILPTPPASLGGRARLSCELDDWGIPYSSIRWKTPATGDVWLTDRGPQLLIDGVKRSDAGNYSCQAVNTLGAGSPDSMDMQVFEPAFLVDRLALDTRAKEGDSQLKLECSGRGGPLPNITWLKDGELIVDSENREELSSSDFFELNLTRGVLSWRRAVQWSDKGQYTCRAFNGAGTPAEASGTLAVTHKPVIVNDPLALFVAVNLGEVARISCKIAADPPATVEWRRNDRVISPSIADNKYEVVDESNSSWAVQVSTLVVSNVLDNQNTQDLGAYTCTASNTLGSDSKDFTVQHRSAPLPPYDLKLLQAGTDWLRLGWVPGFDGGFQQFFHLQLLDRHHQLSYEIRTNESSLLGWNSPFHEYNLSSPAQSTRGAIWRLKRHVGIERAAVFEVNATGLQLLSEYRARVRGFNLAGWSEFCPDAAVSTVDYPTDSSIEVPKLSSFDSSSKLLKFDAPRHSGSYCMQLYAVTSDSDGSLTAGDCVKFDDNQLLLNGISGQLKSIQARYCLKQPAFLCSKAAKLPVSGGLALSGVDLWVAILVPLIVLLLLLLCFVFYCVWRKRRSPAHLSKKLAAKKLAPVAYKNGGVGQNNIAKKQLHTKITPQSISAPQQSTLTHMATGNNHHNQQQQNYYATGNGYTSQHHLADPFAASTDSGVFGSAQCLAYDGAGKAGGLAGMGGSHAGSLIDEPDSPGLYGLSQVPDPYAPNNFISGYGGTGYEPYYAGGYANETVGNGSPYSTTSSANAQRVFREVVV